MRAHCGIFPKGLRMDMLHQRQPLFARFLLAVLALAGLSLSAANADEPSPKKGEKKSSNRLAREGFRQAHLYLCG